MNGQMRQECEAKKEQEGVTPDELCAEPQASWQAMERQTWRQAS